MFYVALWNRLQILLTLSPDILRGGMMKVVGVLLLSSMIWLLKALSVPTFMSQLAVILNLERSHTICKFLFYPVIRYLLLLQLLLLHLCQVLILRIIRLFIPVLRGIVVAFDISIDFRRCCRSGREMSTRLPYVPHSNLVTRFATLYQRYISCIINGSILFSDHNSASSSSRSPHLYLLLCIHISCLGVTLTDFYIILAIGKNLIYRQGTLLIYLLLFWVIVWHLGLDHALGSCVRNLTYLGEVNIAHFGCHFLYFIIFIYFTIRKQQC